MNFSDREEIMNKVAELEIDPTNAIKHIITTLVIDSVEKVQAKDQQTISDLNCKIYELQGILSSLNKEIFGTYAKYYDLDTNEGRLKIKSDLISGLNSTKKEVTKTSEKLLCLNISNEHGSEIYRVNKKHISFVDAILECFDFKENDQLQDHLLNSDILLELLKTKCELDFEKACNESYSDNKWFEYKDLCKIVKKLFNILIKDDSISLRYFSEILASLLPVHRMSHNKISWN